MKRQRRVQCNGITGPGIGPAVLRGMCHRRDARHDKHRCGINIGPAALAVPFSKSAAGRPVAGTPEAVARAT